MTVNAQYAQEHFDEFLSAVESGEPIEITRDGKASIRLTLVPPAVEPPDANKQQGPYRNFGMARGLIWLAPDWDSPETNAEIAADFENSEIFPLTI